jgi:hypothetical protein
MREQVVMTWNGGTGGYDMGLGEQVVITFEH